MNRSYAAQTSGKKRRLIDETKANRVIVRVAAGRESLTGQSVAKAVDFIAADVPIVSDDKAVWMFPQSHSGSVGEIGRADRVVELVTAARKQRLFVVNIKIEACDMRIFFNRCLRVKTKSGSINSVALTGSKIICRIPSRGIRKYGNSGRVNAERRENGVQLSGG